MKVDMKNYQGNYRKYYQKMTGHMIDKNVVVHHLNGNHYDCRIENLLAIDAFIHRNEHKNLIHIYNGTKPPYCEGEYLEWYNETKKEYDKAMKIKEEYLKIKEGSN